MPSGQTASVRRALVLGGGAILGAYWESGLLRGLSDGRGPIHGFDAIVGTSAGAMVAAALANGRWPESPDERARHRAAGRSPEPSFPFDLSGIDAEAFKRVFGLWATTHRSTVEQCAAIGALARRIDRRHAEAWIADFETRQLGEWGSQQLHVVAVDAESGTRRVFRERDGVPLPIVVAASCALPGICPPVEIESRFYMDGGVHSTTNADVLVAERHAQVLVVMPTNALTSSRFGGFAERMLEQEVAELRANGCDVRVATPTARDTQRFGTELMDYARVDDAYTAGLEAGREWANALETGFGD